MRVSPFARADVSFPPIGGICVGRGSYLRHPWKASLCPDPFTEYNHLILHINTELFYYKVDDMGREHSLVRLHTHSLQFAHVLFAPVHQRLCGNAGTFG